VRGNSEASANERGYGAALDLRTVIDGRDRRPQSRAAFEARHARHEPHAFVGLWVTADGRIRHALLSNGSYEEARGERDRAYCGRYVITGRYIDYLDDTGFVADGEFIGNELHHFGMVLTRRAR
jgi:hypothetical protein